MKDLLEVAENIANKCGDCEYFNDSKCYYDPLNPVTVLKIELACSLFKRNKEAEINYHPKQSCLKVDSL